MYGIAEGLMKLTMKSEYSLVLLLRLARGDQQIPVQLQRLAVESGVPVKFAEQLFSILKQAGIVRAKRGVSGGYLLAKEADKITLAEVIRLMDGALAPTGVVSRHFFTHTPVEKEEKLVGVFREIRDFIADRLEKLTLADML